MGLKGLYSI